MTKEANKRRDTVLKIIVNEYIATALPVASESILRHHRLGVSPATIRNDMAFLEEEGYITRPYTSSGGVPLDKAYRYYVETISENVGLPSEEQKRIRSALNEAVDEYDRLLKMAANIMAHLVGNAAIVTQPMSSENKFRHMELVEIHEYMALLVLVLSNAVLRRQILTFEEPVDQAQLSQVANKFNREFSGHSRSLIEGNLLEMTPVEKKITEIVTEIMASEDRLEHENSYLEGLRLMLGQPEFTQRDRMLNILEFMEARGWLRHVIDWQIASDGVKVIIGGENRESAPHDLSLVLGSYGVRNQVGGTIGIIGPTRMDYRKAISAVNYVSGLLSEVVFRIYQED
jgi:heat-inducible transcriptional repressor